uniref:VWFA domain-containing protein n=1 Tax=Paramoeba aestuarina TaxID=180227 RepID=A0A7S4L1M7_9EUKA|eukprot:CAMPEP_0201509182 /NCGR_PEP_ID=MMETSP0161_2-20130828/2308_1 /ASSEMBLY_ACC=CAM_ASM_000251 /TAXON_ID=180227 /ORGANISM="Neoparamoeba aestuarina, Strain SoJaBio B1-5/56/2" /LENGTH=359 /DNA_ID=CAMNT_0047904057 /DNA_START=115 /DNA_END=1194 /DNA_ORIENTATION=-
MRNGDYSSSRMDSQEDAVLMLATSKLNSNPESTVAVVSMAKGVDVKLTLTTDEGALNAAVRQTKVGGESNLANSLKVSQLLLKNRQNKHGDQRIVCFVGSPIQTDEKDLVRLGKLLRKNGIAVDVVSFGEESENSTKLDAFVATVNKTVDGADNSHLITVPAGPHVLSEILLSTPLFAGTFGMDAGGGGMGAGLGAMPGGDDPELAAAILQSCKEEEERIRKLQEEQAGSEGAAEAQSEAVEMEEDDGMDESMRAAIEMSILEANEAGVEVVAEEGDDDEDMDDELALAMEISKQLEEAEAAGGGDEQGDDVADIMNDPSFLESVLGELDGVDMDDPRIKEALGGDEEKSDDKKDEEKK